MIWHHTRNLDDATASRTGLSICEDARIETVQDMVHKRLAHRVENLLLATMRHEHLRSPADPGYKNRRTTNVKIVKR